MSRSVEIPAYAAFTVYLAPEEPFEDSMDWGDYQDSVSMYLAEIFPSLSMQTSNRYPGNQFDRETVAIAENLHGTFTLSEYCGLVALSFVVDDTTEHAGLSERWAEQAHERLKRVFPDQLVPIARASNGETFYERMEA